MHAIILGCGGASGVPGIGQQWGACDPHEPKNRRRRASILIRSAPATDAGAERRAKQGNHPETGADRDHVSLLVDTGPDLRSQLLDAGISALDAVLYTHTHADHTHGIDDIRALNRLQRRVIDAWGTENDLNHLCDKFSYIFDPPKLVDEKPIFFKPCLRPRSLSWFQPVSIAGIEVVAFPQNHGFMMSTGYRFGHTLAYSTDLVDLPDESFEALSGIDVWIVGCLQENPHPTHAHLERVLGWIDRVRPRRAILTHLSHTLDYASLQARLPAGVEPAYDGMVIHATESVPASPAGSADDDRASTS